MPADFDIKEHGLTKLRVALLHGLVFATFSAEAEPLEEYLGPQVLPWLDRSPALAASTAALSARMLV